MDLTIGEILGTDGRLAARLPNYEIRPQQLEMAAAVARALDRSEHLLVEAGTGTGKSFAYLVPAILHAAQSRATDAPSAKRIIISTHTISLQEQLLGKDLPLLNSVIPLEFSAVLVKGRNNYMSLRRLQNAQQRADSLFHQPEEFDQLGTLRRWSQQTDDGSRSDLPFQPRAALWDEVASDSGNCMGRNCPRHDDCFYYRARRRAQHAQLLIVNHALFFSDLGLRQAGVSILPDYDAVILDEAHTVEAVAGDHLGLRLTSGQLDYNLRRLFNDRTNKGLLVDGKSSHAQQQVNRCRDEVERFVSDIDEWVMGQPASFNGRVVEPQIVANRLGPAIVDLAERVRERASASGQEGSRQDFVAAADRLLGLADLLDRWLRQTLPDTVYWVQRSYDRQGIPRFTLAAAPLDVGSVLGPQLFQAVPSVTLTSATLTTGSNDFRYFQSRATATARTTWPAMFNRFQNGPWGILCRWVSPSVSASAPQEQIQPQ